MRFIIAMAVALFVAPAAYEQHVKVVGIGASTCSRFSEEVGRNPRVQRDYFAWAQAFMSAVLLNAPKGRDETLDLSPEAFSLQQQASFLYTYCRQNPRALPRVEEAGWREMTSLVKSKCFAS
ncbi:MAG: hypothetical protein ACXWUP_12550 [Allosphingosinicella sp.]